MGVIKRVNEMDLALLCHQFSLILKSGIHPVEGIPLIFEDVRNPFIKKALKEISEETLKGVPLYEAFEKTKLFPAYMVAMIKVGEKTGMLEAVLDSLSSFYENEADIKKKIRSSVSYPIVLAVLMSAVIALISLKVIPMFIEILTSMGGDIPKQVYLFMTIGNLLKNGLLYVMIMVIILLAGYILLTRMKKAVFWLDKFKVTNPLFGGIYKKITASRFSEALSLTLRNGMSIVEGFGMVSGVLSNQYVMKKAKEASRAITDGKDFAESISNTRLFPQLFIRLIKTGEKTGSLDEMMKKISTLYKEEVDASLRRIVSYIEPVCVTLLSLVLAGVLLSVILPLINIMSSIG